MPGPAAVAEAKAAVVEAFGQCGTMLEACRRAGQTHSVAREWRASDPAFALALDQAHDVYIQVLEEKARQIAVDDADPKTVMFLLRCLSRDKYGDTRRMEHSGPGGGPIVIQSAGQVEAQIIAVAHQFPTVCPRIRQVLQNILDKLPKHD